MMIDFLAVLPIAVLTALVLACVVCIIALFRAERADTVAVLKALPEVVATLLRFRRRR
ncbi:hypothetical protein [Streptomyces solincola]|uniref:hypothetical protein n=1 Tax=Streptomyces solincola TaxID=2100817 RepID=UPI0015E3EB61|nr:hypothetical protein [Streptomyces solincola]